MLGRSQSRRSAERAYGADEILAICKRSGAPRVFDAPHHIVHEGLHSHEDASVNHMLRGAAKTWPQADWQLTRISNRRADFGDVCHRDLIHTLLSCDRPAPWIELEVKVEVKAKARAIFALREHGCE